MRTAVGVDVPGSPAPIIGKPAVDDWPFEGLYEGQYKTILIDPPWHYRTWSGKGETKSPQSKYRTMSLGEIKALPVWRLAARDCLLCCWATYPLLKTALDVIEAWDFVYSTAGSWEKLTRGGKTAFGTGYRLRGAGEPYLLATRGHPPLGARNVRNVIRALRRQHSRKSDDLYDDLEAIGQAPRCELFATQIVPGWDGWGDELGKYSYEGRPR